MDKFEKRPKDRKGGCIIDDVDGAFVFRDCVGIFRHAILCLEKYFVNILGQFFQSKKIPFALKLT